jgi:hypothetical protein
MAADTIYGGPNRIIRGEYLNPRPGQDLVLGRIRRGVLSYDGIDLNTQRQLPFKLGVYTGPGATGASGFAGYQNWLGCQEMIGSDNMADAQWSDLTAPNFIWENWGPVCLANPQMWLQLSCALIPDTLTSSNFANGVAGDYDSMWNTLGDYIVTRAPLGIKRIIFRLHHEFNLRTPVINASDFKAYWIRVVGLLRAKFTAASGVEALFCWNPSNHQNNYQAYMLDDYWPGDVQTIAATTYGGIANAAPLANLDLLNSKYPFRRRFASDYVDYIGIDIYDQSPGDGIYVANVQPSRANQARAMQRYVANFNEFFSPYSPNFAADYRSNGLAYMHQLSHETSTPLCVPEWGLWGVGHNNRPAGGDNPYFIQQMYDWFVRAGVSYACYFDSTQPGSDAWHQLWPGADYTHQTDFPVARDRYLELFGG